MGNCTLRLKKLTSLPDGIAGSAAQKCREWRGCWECQIFSPRLPKVLIKIVEIATEIAGRHCRDCIDCWEWRECRYFQDCRDRRDCCPRLPGLPTLPAEDGWLHAEIEKIDEGAYRDCRGCSPKMPWLQGLLGVPKFQSKVDEGHNQNCWDCERDCRPILQRLQRLLGLPRMQLLARLPRSPRLSPEIDGITDFAGREWVIACWDWKNWPVCRPGLSRLQKIPPKNAATAGATGWMRMPNLQTEIAKIATENVGWHCRDCEDCWDCRECRELQDGRDRRGCSPRLADYRYCRPRVGDCILRLKKLSRLPDKIAGTAAQRCWDLRGCWEWKIFSPGLKNVLTKNVEIATEIAGRHCRDCRDYCQCQQCRYFQGCRDRPHFRPRLPALLIMRAENGWLHAEIEKMTILPAAIAGTEQIAARKYRDCRGCWDWWECGICRQRLPRLRRRLSGHIAETAEIAGNAENSDISRIVENAETVARDCRNYQFCRPRIGDCMLRLKNLTMLPDGINGTAEIATQNCPGWQACWDWWKCQICRQRLPRLRRRLSVDISDSGKIAGISENADNGKIAEIAETVDQDCWRYRYCRPRMGDSTLRLKQLMSLPDGIAGTAAQKCRERRGCWEWRECRFCRQRLPRLRRRLSGHIAETAEIAGSAENSDISRIVENAETVARDCRNYQFCRPRIGDCMLRLKNLTMLPDRINGTAEIAT